jgi:hypothetical protein
MATHEGAASWLFIKGEETIWLLRSAADQIVVCGPGTCREHFHFEGDAAMGSFQVSFAERLMAGGWILWGVDRERRRGQDRRGATREGPDRRLGSPAMRQPAAPIDWA